MSHSSLPPSDAIEYDPQTNTHRIWLDWSRTEPVSTLVVAAVAKAAGVDTTDLEPLYDAVDPEALDELFKPTGSTGRMINSLSFPYSGHLVTVHGDGKVAVRSPDETT